MKTHKLAIWAEHTSHAGRRCWYDYLIESESDDLIIYDDTLEGFKELEKFTRIAANIGHDNYDHFKFNVAETMADFIIGIA